MAERSDQALPQVQAGDHEEPRVRPHDVFAAWARRREIELSVDCPQAMCPCGGDAARDLASGKPLRAIGGACPCGARVLLVGGFFDTLSKRASGWAACSGAAAAAAP